MPTGTDAILQSLGLPSVAQAIPGSTGRSRYSTVPIGQVAYASVGTDTTLVAGTVLFAQLHIPRQIVLKGAAVLNGGTAGSTNLGIISLYDYTGALVANSALAGAAIASTNVFQAYDFTALYTANAGLYWLGFQSNGTTDKIRTIAVSTNIDCLTGSATGTFGVLPAITPTTSITADKGPVGYVYA